MGNVKSRKGKKFMVIVKARARAQVMVMVKDGAQVKVRVSFRARVTAHQRK